MASLHSSLNHKITSSHHFLPSPTQTPTNLTLHKRKGERSIHIRSCSTLSSIEIEESARPLHQIWRQIQGENNWEKLLDPMNPHLRREIIRYGEMAQSCYDSFDFDPHSKYCGTCKYDPPRFFPRLGMSGRGYTLTRYLYATSNINLPNFFQKSTTNNIWSPHANWMGYVAVATDADEIRRLGRRDIGVAWRGTVTYLEWIHDLKDILCPAHFRDDPNVKIESGFFDLYTSKEKEQNCEFCSFSAREQVLAELRRIIHRFRGEELSITITGHSLGAALALLSAYDVAEVKLNSVVGGTIPVTVFSFAGPRVGNLRFKERCDELGIKVLRVVNVHDRVPRVPGIITNEKFQYQKYLEDAMSFPWSYAHVGVELGLDHTHSPFLKNTKDLRCAHNLEAHLHLLDGYHGKVVVSVEERRSTGEQELRLLEGGIWRAAKLVAGRAQGDGEERGGAVGSARTAEDGGASGRHGPPL
ncbi:phospholipase A1-Igamma3, chloroplastic-like isoform X2 [Salvia splendens]|uniref:phospholipase A1-Igamma3, chloroplastic-like isoform X2 n=1 Tax=Salvia splendens TaxID=180675 RepID=UPI001C26BDE2|nr:phospholipase A1-Igamma3, chloroplastic-like isoform X2 [Salvia splendens]